MVICFPFLLDMLPCQCAAKSTSKLEDANLKCVRELVWNARSQWFEIGIQLNFCSGDLAAIKQNHQLDCGDCFTALLTQWLRRSNPTPTWKALVDAMNSHTVKVKVKLESKGRN